jgi:hypothetical protein
MQRYRKAGRVAEEYALNLPKPQLEALYAAMLSRAETLEKQAEWYHTLFNSCVTNTIRHIDEIRAEKRSWLSYGGLILAPQRIVS